MQIALMTNIDYQLYADDTDKDYRLFFFTYSSDNGFFEFLHEYCTEKSETCTKF